MFCPYMDILGVMYEEFIDLEGKSSSTYDTEPDN